MDNKKIDSKWIKGIPYEIAFWRNVYRWNKTFKGLMMWSNFGAKISLEEFNVNDFLCGKENPLVLDIGCGMSYATGNLLESKGITTELDIHYVDPLAPYFNDILKKTKKDLPEIEFGIMEHLSLFYLNNTVDLAIIQNALDHSSNPIRGILESIEVLKVGGILYLNHHPNEAVMENYKGFHQYNIIDEDGKLIIWNKKDKWNINELIKNFADIKVYRNDNGHVVAVITKKNAITIPLDNVDVNIDDLFCLIKKHSKKFSFKCRYLLYNSIQFFAQSLSWEMKMKLKKIIKQA